MKICSIVASAMLLVATQAIAQTPAGPYVRSCGDIKVAGNVLTATCARDDKVKQPARLMLPCQLPSRIENRNGALVCAK